MTMRFPLGVAAMLWAASAATTAQAASQCLTPAEAESTFLVIAPEAFKSAGTACAAQLPADAFLRQTNSVYLQKLQTEADLAWPIAKSGIAKMAGEDAAPLLTGDSARPMITALIGSMIVQKIKPADCLAANTLLALIAPLPPKNLARITVTILQLSQRKDGKSSFKICPAPVQ